MDMIMMSVRGIFSGFLRMLNIEVGILFKAVALFFFRFLICHSNSYVVPGYMKNEFAERFLR